MAENPSDPSIGDSGRGRFDLQWDAPGACPDAVDGRRRVERFLGRPVGAPDDPEVRAQVIVRERDGLFVAAITLADTPARELSAERCDTVAEAAAYVIAAWIDPSVEPPELTDDPAPIEPSPAADAPPTRKPIAPPKPPPRRAPRLRGAVRIGSGVALGALPRVGAGLELGVALLRGRLRAELDVVHLPARPARVEGRPGVGGDIRLTTAMARICALAITRPIELPLCAGFEVGSMHGRGVGIDEAARKRLLWAAFTASLGLVWMPSRVVGLWIDATLHVPTSRPIFDAVNVGRIHQPGPAAFTGMLGVEARFP